MDKDSKIHFGYKDEFFCFKVCESGKLDYMIKQLQALKCVITYHDTKSKKLIIKDDFEKFISKDIQQMGIDFKDKPILNNHELAISNSDGLRSFEPIYMDNIGSEIDCPIKINFIGSYVQFIMESSKFLAENLTARSIYLGKPISHFMRSFLLQPIKVIYNDTEYLINAIATVYSSGNIIIEYSIPLEEIEFKFICNDTNYKINSKAYIPKYIAKDTSSYDYHDISYRLEDAFELYNKYILERFKKYSKSNISRFTNFTLVHYDEIPENFDSMSINLCRNIYWILNTPYGYINEREKDEYRNFNKIRYSISNYASLFVSTNSRSVIIYNKQVPTNLAIKDWYTEQIKYEGALIFILPSIEMVLIKKSYYNMLSRESLNNEDSLKNLRKKYSQIVDINNYLFSMRYNGYGTIGTLQNYLESNLTDFLPSGFLEKNLDKYKEIIQIKESQSRENNNYLIALISMLFPILFGLDAIKSMLSYLDCHFNKDLSQYTLEIWILIIILIVLFLIRGELIKIPCCIKKGINRCISLIKNDTKQSL